MPLATASPPPPDGSLTIGLALTSGNGALSGTVSRAAAAGVATFSGLSINQLGSKVLTAQTTSSAGGLAVASGSFTITAGPGATADYPFDIGTNANYTFGPQVTFAGGNVALTPVAAVADNAATAFAGGTGVGVVMDASAGYLRLGSAGGCDARTTNCSELDASWTPKYGSLVGYWKLNGSGSIADGQSIAATVGAPLVAHNADGSGMAFAPGRLNQGIYFDGNDDYLALSDLTVLNANALTVAAWYTTGAPSSFARLFDFTSAQYSQEKSWFFSPNQMPGPWLRAVNNSYSVNAQLFVNPKAGWRHMIATLDGQAMALYLDGQLFQVLINSNTGAIIAPTTAYFGQSTYNDPRFQGTMDELAIWNTTLNANDVAALYQRQLATYAGTYTSKTFDSFAPNQAYTQLAWRTTLPFLKNLPSNQASETATSYPALATDSLETSISLLWHLDEKNPAALGPLRDFIDDTGLGNVGIIQNNGGLSNLFFVGVTRLLGGSIDLYGGQGWASSTTQITSPSVFTLSTWFKSPSPEGGRLLGFGNSQNAISVDQNKQADRHFYVSNTGQLSFGIYTGQTGAASTITNPSGAQTQVLTGGQRIITSAAGNLVNDNRWHHAVGTLAAAGGSALYLDGQLLGQDTGAVASAGANYSGYWKLAGENIMGSVWPNLGNTNWITASVDEVAVWGRSLGAAEVKQLWRRGANRLSFQVRACQLPGCADNPSWVGPDGTASSYFSELNNVSGSTVRAGPPSLDFSSFADLTAPAGRYFQYRAVMESDDSLALCTYGGVAQACSPELTSVNVATTYGFDTSGPAVGNLQPVAFHSLTSFARTLAPAGCPGGITFALSADGSSYFYYTGSVWAASSGVAQSSAPAQLTATAMGQFAAQVGVGSIYFRAYLGSSGSQACALDDVAIGLGQ